MNDTPTDGEPAFPRSSQGMTLRDYFAAKAMCGEVTAEGKEDYTVNAENIAERAYVMADAMLEARKREGKRRGNEGETKRK